MNIKNCPFCGENPSHWVSDNGAWHRIVCTNILCKMAMVATTINTEQSAIEDWNKRIEPINKEYFEYLDGSFRVLMQLLQSDINQHVAKVLNEENYSVAALSQFLSLNKPY
uniref:Putative restriction alleviation protein n=1 Tax=viral metagenome TaxID=1070528 RepID=A0A6M3LBJ8_9ZZZZ